MATVSDSGLVADVSTDARFRAFIQFVDGALAGGGWVHTADTGQLDPTTATHPAASNTVVGYRMYRMDDTLQATKPVFLKLGFGSGAAALHPHCSFLSGPDRTAR